MKLNEYLKEERIKKKFTLEDINSKTRIRKEYIEAIENGEYDKLPKGLYLYGFLRLYAKFLNLNSEEVIDLYRQNNYIKENKIDRKISLSDVANRKIKKRKTALPFLLFCLAVVTFFFIINLDNYSKKKGGLIAQEQIVIPPTINNDKIVIDNLVKQQNANIKPIKNKTKKEGTKVVALRKNKKNIKKNKNIVIKDKKVVDTDSLTLVFYAKHKCWLRIYADNKVVFEGLAYKGNTKTLKAKENFIVNIGDINGVNIKINNKRIDVKRNSDRGLNKIRINKNNINEWVIP